MAPRPRPHAAVAVAGRRSWRRRGRGDGGEAVGVERPARSTATLTGLATKRGRGCRRRCSGCRRRRGRRRGASGLNSGASGSAAAGSTNSGVPSEGGGPSSRASGASRRTRPWRRGGATHDGDLDVADEAAEVELTRRSPGGSSARVVGRKRCGPMLKRRSRSRAWSRNGGCGRGRGACVEREAAGCARGRRRWSGERGDGGLMRAAPHAAAGTQSASSVSSSAFAASVAGEGRGTPVVPRRARRPAAAARWRRAVRARVPAAGRRWFQRALRSQSAGTRSNTGSREAIARDVRIRKSVRLVRRRGCSATTAAAPGPAPGRGSGRAARGVRRRAVVVDAAAAQRAEREAGVGPCTPVGGAGRGAERSSGWSTPVAQPERRGQALVGSQPRPDGAVVDGASLAPLIEAPVGTQGGRRSLRASTTRQAAEAVSQSESPAGGGRWFRCATLWRGGSRSTHRRSGRRSRPWHATAGATPSGARRGGCTSMAVEVAALRRHRRGDGA